MERPALEDDFKEFLRLLNSHGVEYLLIGGHAVGHHGYPRSTADMDVWVGISPDNAAHLVAALRAFGFAAETVAKALFLDENQIVRMGVQPYRIEILTTISGVSFADCHPKRVTATLDGIGVPIIDLASVTRQQESQWSP
jgi:hypothetical protein